MNLFDGVEVKVVKFYQTLRQTSSLPILNFITKFIMSLADTQNHNQLIHKLSLGEAVMIKYNFLDYINIVPEHFHNFDDIFDQI